MKIYEGTENYIFVSYAHADSDRVLPILEALDREGFRIWYDSGIEAGSEWAENLDCHLDTCYGMIVFITPASVASRNCRNEIGVALSLNKEVLVVYLEETELLYGLRYQLASIQAINRNKFDSDRSFIEALSRAKVLQSCKQASCEKKEPMTITRSTTSDVPKRVYISYRRDGGDLVAKILSEELKRRGHRVFLDQDSLSFRHSDKTFDKQILKALANDDNFILVLSPHALDRCNNEDDWLRKEIAMALYVGQNIIPVLLPGFTFPAKLPKDIANISKYDGIHYVMAFFDAVVEEIAKRLE